MISKKDQLEEDIFNAHAQYCASEARKLPDDVLFSFLIVAIGARNLFGITEKDPVMEKKLQDFSERTNDELRVMRNRMEREHASSK